MASHLRQHAPCTTRSRASTSAPTRPGRRPCPTPATAWPSPARRPRTSSALAGVLRQHHLRQRGQRRQPHGLRHDQNFVENNLIGIDANGTAPLGNGQDGVLVTGQASSNFIGAAAVRRQQRDLGQRHLGRLHQRLRHQRQHRRERLHRHQRRRHVPVPNTNNGLDIVFGAQSQHRRRDDGRRPQRDLGQPPRGRPDRLRRHAEQRGRGQLHRHRRHRQGPPDRLAAARRRLRRPRGGQQHHRRPEPRRRVQHRRLERHLGQRRQWHPGHRQRHDRHGDLRQLHRDRRHRRGRPAQRRQRRHDRGRDLQYAPSSVRDVRHREPQRHLGQPGRRALDHVLVGQQSSRSTTSASISTTRSPCPTAATACRSTTRRAIA